MQQIQVRSESERFLGVGNGNPLQYSCLENSTYICTAHMTDVLHTYHHSQEYTRVLMKFLKVDKIHEEHHRCLNTVFMKVHYECRWPYGFNQPCIKTIWGNRTSLVVQWLRLCASNAGAQVQSLVREVQIFQAVWQKKKKKLGGKKFQKVLKSKTCVCLQLATIYTVLGIISNVEMI